MKNFLMITDIHGSEICRNGECAPRRLPCGPSTDVPRMTPSIRIALDDLQLESIAVVYPGTQRFSIAPSVEAVPLHEVWQNGI